MTEAQSINGTFDCRTDSINVIHRALSADRHGDIRAVIVKPNAASATQAVVEHCWHDAAVIVEDAA